MSTIRPPEERVSPAGASDAPPRSRVGRRVGLTVGCILAVGIVFGGVLLLSFMVDETHFDRPTAELDELTAQLWSVRGVDDISAERWVEAPFFTNPTTWIGLTIAESALPELTDTICTMNYPDAAMWSMRVRTSSGTEVTLSGDTIAHGQEPAAVRCPRFGFDAAPLITEIDRIAPGVAVQPSIWNDETFALVAVDETAPGFSSLLPLVAHAGDLVAAAGLDAERSLEINAMTLGAIIRPGEADRFHAMLSELTTSYGVTDFWADGGGTPTDGVERVQIVAPPGQHAEIERVVRASGLQIADDPIRFIEH